MATNNPGLSEPQLTAPPRQYKSEECSLETQPPTHTHTRIATEPIPLGSGQGHSRPEPLRASSSPPASPTKAKVEMRRTGTACADDSKSLHDSGELTPPATPPVLASHSCEGYISSSDIKPLNIVAISKQPDDSTFSGRTTARTVSADKPLDKHDDKAERATTEIKVFPYWEGDYDAGEKGKRKMLGNGLWSDVYLAIADVPPPSFALPATKTTSTTGIDSTEASPRPAVYAIKLPASRTAKHVINQEARILSHLSRLPHSSDHIVHFYGQDTRTGALVLKAMDGTLESWTQDALNTLPETERCEKMASVFRPMAMQLIDGLLWLMEQGCVHADIKPANVLLSISDANSPANVQPPTCIYSDFSSAMLTSLPLTSEDGKAAPTSPLGGGTWDYLDPTLLCIPKPTAENANPVRPSPNAESDVWALAITLMYLVIGGSPFDCVGSNVFRRRETIKHGTPLAYVGYGDEGVRSLKRLDGLESKVGFDVRSWFGRVLVKDVERRVGLVEWRKELGKAGGGV